MHKLESDYQELNGSEKTAALAQKNTAMAIPRVLLADDREEVLQALLELLAGEFQIVGTAEDGIRVLDRAGNLAPDVVVLDIEMPVVNGIEAATRLREKCPSARVVMLTVHKDADFVEAAISAGALGYVIKSSLATDLIPAIRKAFIGETFVSPSIDLE